MTSKIFISFLLLLLFQKIFNQQDLIKCENNTNIESRNDCFALSDAENYCCYSWSETPHCHSVKKDEIKNNYQYDCGISEENYGKYEFSEYHPNQNFDLGFQHCGKPEPKKAKDCTDFSEINNSCCFFQKGSQTACLAIGRKHDSKNLNGNFEFEDENKVKQNIKFDCLSYNLIINLSAIFLIFLIL